MSADDAGRGVRLIPSSRIGGDSRTGTAGIEGAAWTTERQPGDDEECERLGCEDRTHPVHHRSSGAFLEAVTTLVDAVLDRPFADPDDDAAKAARAVLRARLPTQASDSPEKTT